MEKSLISKSYFYEINFIRAIAALSVVMVHVTATNYSLNDGYLNWLTLFLNQIVRYGTPFFAVISGFLLYNQVINRGFETKRFLKSRVTKVVIPFVIWSYVYLLVKTNDYVSVLTPENMKSFIYDFVLGKSHYHLYFIAVVIQFYLLFILIQKFTSKKHLLYLTIVGFFITYFNFVHPYQSNSEVLNTFLTERAFIFNWLFYFFFGGLLVHYWSGIVTFVRENIKYILSIGIIPFVFIVYEYSAAERILNSTRVTNLFYVPVLFIVFISGYYILENYKKIRDMILSVGNMSMGIYLVHPLVIYISRDYFPWMFAKTRWILLGYIFVVIFSIIIVKLIHKLPLGQYVVIVASPRKRKG